MIIVTGGAGFIGSNLVKALNDKGREDILIVDDLKGGENYKNLKGLRFLDYRHKDDFLDSVENDDFDGTDIDALFHEGACSDTMEYDVNYMMKVNYEYSKMLLHFCMQHRVPFFYASSASTYGGGKNGFTEGDKCEDALNPYAFSKLIFDRYVRRVIPEAHSPIVGLKYFNVYGPQEQHKGKMASIFHQLYRQIAATGKAKLFKGTDGYEDGGQRRDFVYVKDVVKVNLWFWEHKGASGIYNCGTGTAHTYNEAAEAVIEAMGRGEIQYIDFPEILRGKYQNYTEADPKKLLAAGYDGGFTDFKTAVKEYCGFLDKGGYFSYEETGGFS